MVALVERLPAAPAVAAHPVTPTQFEALWQAAEAAGRAAAQALVPKPMVVVEDPMCATGPVVQAWVVNEGVCGFAWVHVKGNTPFGRWAKKTGRMDSDYPKGLCYWIHHYNQSMSRKEAHAQAFAQVLREAGVEAYARSRMD